jgi:transcriptional regulator of acetoin/glycerol metabolism
MERAVIMCESAELQVGDFGALQKHTTGDFIFGHLNLEKLEEWAVRKALTKHSGNVSQAAEELGLSRGALYRRIEQYGI